MGPGTLTLTECRVCPDIFSHVHETHQKFSLSCHIAEEVEIYLQLAICLFCLMMVMKRSSIDFRIIDFSKKKLILCVIQQNATLMWCHSHKRHALQELTVSAHNRVTARSSWYRQLFYWNRNTNVRCSEVTDWENSPKEEELAGQCLLQEVPMEKPLRKLGHWMQY